MRFSLLNFTHPVVGKSFFRYWRYTGKRNRSKKLVEKKVRFGFVLYPVNFREEKPSFCLCKKNIVVIKLILYKKCSSGKVSPGFICPCNKNVVFS